MLIIHLFNSSSVSGPERLVLPALASLQTSCLIVNLREERIVRVNGVDPLEEYAHSLGLSYRAIAVDVRWDRQAMAQLHHLLRELKPDLVHAHGLKASMYLLQAKGRTHERLFPVVSTHHGIHGTPDWKVWLYEQFYRRVSLKRFDRVLAVSTADNNVLLHSGLKKERVRLHLNGMDGRLVRIEQRAEEARRSRILWFPSEMQGYRPFLFGVIARLSPEKDHERLLRVLACLNELSSHRDWKCLLFGTGALERSLRQQVREAGLQKRILWMGHRKEVAQELAGLDLLLSFSKAEGLPINLIEAGWSGTPVMSTRVGGVTDLIPDESYGNLFEPGESPEISAYQLLHALSPEGRADLQQQARRFQGRVLSEFTQRQWLGRLAAIYSELGVLLEMQSALTTREDSRKGDRVTV